MPDPRNTDEFKNQYEFSADEEREIASLAGNMRLSATASAFFGGLSLVIAALHLFVGNWSGHVLTPIIFCGVGVAFVFLSFLCSSASKSFVEIVDTQGGDVTHLMHGVGDLQRFFRWHALLLYSLIGGISVTVGYLLFL